MSDSPASAVTFRISRDGKSVFRLRLAASPNKCGSGGETPRQSSDPASISGGKFRATVRFKTTAGAVYATTKVKGQFIGRRGARGTATTTFKDAESQYCNGTFDFSAKAQ
jgi:hypothetical protein